MGPTVETSRITYAVTEPVTIVPAQHSPDRSERSALLTSDAVPSTWYTRWGKRLFDLIGASLLLVVLAVPMLAIAITIRLTTDGSVFYAQTRVGLRLRRFRCLKFRTMVPNAEAILAENDDLRQAMSANWKLHNDPRITSVGRFLRQSSLDELPQLINVILGEMSLVGPRPVQPLELAEKYGADGQIVTTVRPGMTGVWQVSGRSMVSYEDRVDMDLGYISQVTLGQDIRILLRTVKEVALGTGAA